MDDQSKEGKARLNISNMATGTFIGTFLWMKRMSEDWSFLYAVGELVAGCLIVYLAIMLMQSATNAFCDISYGKLGKIDIVKMVGGAFLSAFFISGAIYR